VGSFGLYIPAVLIALCLVFLPRLISDASMYATVTYREHNRLALFYLFIALFLLLLYFFVIVIFSRGRINIGNAAVFYMMTVYVTVSFVCIVCLRNQENGAYLYLLPFIGALSSDTFAYFFGCAFGKHKLIPEISPKKTIEGSISGIFFGALSFVLYGWILKTWFLPSSTPNYLVLALSGIIVSAISQCGDLIASAVKRYYGVKDFGNLFPGHGGVLDRFDSVLATAPVLYIITSLFSDMLH